MSADDLVLPSGDAMLVCLQTIKKLIYTLPYFLLVVRPSSNVDFDINSYKKNCIMSVHHVYYLIKVV